MAFLQGPVLYVQFFQKVFELLWCIAGYIVQSEDAGSSIFREYQSKLFDDGSWCRIWKFPQNQEFGEVVY